MSKFTRIRQDRQLCNATRKRLVRSLILSIMLYNSDLWTIWAVDRKNIDTFEMSSWKIMLSTPWTIKRTKSILDQLTIKRKNCSPSATSKFSVVLGYMPNLEKLVVVKKLRKKTTRLINCLQSLV